MGGTRGTRHGFPVLVYLAAQPLSCSFSMLIRCNVSRKQMTLMLRTSASAYTSGGDVSDDVAFVAQYDADNLLPAPTGGTATTNPSQARYDEVARNQTGPHLITPSLNTLTLQLKQTAPLWCSRSASLVPNAQPGAAESFNELVDWSKATNMRIAFDAAWLDTRMQNLLSATVNGNKENYTGFPVGDHYSKDFKRADWTIFGPLGSEPVNKRPRSASSSPALPPTYKRRAVSKQREPETPQPRSQPHSPPFDNPSPTERATSSISSDSQDDQLFDKALQEHAVESHLPIVTRHLLPEVLGQLLPTLLPEVLEQLLPSLLPFCLQGLLVLPSSLLSTSTNPPSEPSPDLTALGATFIPHLVAHLKPQLQKLHQDALDQGAGYCLEAGALEFQETVEIAQAELAYDRDEALKDLGRIGVEVLENAREHALNFNDEIDVETVATHVKRISEAGEAAETLVRAKFDISLGVMQGWPLIGKAGYGRCMCPCAASGQSIERASAGGRRAGKGGYRGLGNRWRTPSRRR